MFRKIFAVALMAVMAVMAVGATAQDFKKFRFGPTAGLNLASNSASAVKPKVGFSVGVLGEYNFTNKFYMTSALKFSLKSSKFPRGSYNPYYLEIPIHGGYRYSFNDKFSVFGELGPYIGIGICGKAYESDVRVKDDDFRDITMDYFGDFKIIQS